MSSATSQGTHMMASEVSSDPQDIVATTEISGDGTTADGEDVPASNWARHSLAAKGPQCSLERGGSNLYRTRSGSVKSLAEPTPADVNTGTGDTRRPKPRERSSCPDLDLFCMTTTGAGNETANDLSWLCAMLDEADSTRKSKQLGGGQGGATDENTCGLSAPSSASATSIRTLPMLIRRMSIPEDLRFGSDPASLGDPDDDNAGSTSVQFRLFETRVSPPVLRCCKTRVVCTTSILVVLPFNEIRIVIRRLI